MDHPELWLPHAAAGGLSQFPGCPAPSACTPHRAALTQPEQPLTFKSSKAALCTVYSVAGRQQNIGIRKGRRGKQREPAEEAAVNPARLLGTGVVADDKS